MRHLPNLITLIRLLLILPAGWSILAGRFEPAFVLFLLAGASDGLDGWLARRYGWTSRFGAIADPLADKLLVAVVYVALVWIGVLPLWLAVLVLGRDLTIVAGASGYHLLVERIEMAPTALGKVCTLAHILYVGMVLASLVGEPLSLLAPLVTPGGWIIAGLTLVSGLDYVRIWAGRAAVRGGEGEGDADHGRG